MTVLFGQEFSSHGDLLRVQLIGGPADGLWFALRGGVDLVIVPVPLWGSTGQAMYQRTVLGDRTVLKFTQPRITAQ